MSSGLTPLKTRVALRQGPVFTRACPWVNVHPLLSP
jgi:hypothetical protein